MKAKAILSTLCVLSLALPAISAATTNFYGAQLGEPSPPDFANPAYVFDYYAPPPDWVPQEGIWNYTLNTRTPEIVWVKHNGSYGPGVRIRPIDPKWIEKEIESGLIHANRAKAARQFSESAEQRLAGNRTIVLRDLNVPANFTALVFRVKAEVVNTDAELVVSGDVIGNFKTSDCKDVVVEDDGVKRYTFPMTPKNSMLNTLSIGVSPIKGALADAKQEITVFDLHFKCIEPRVTVKSPPPRAFFTSSGEPVTNIYAYLESNAAALDSKPLPTKGWKRASLDGDHGVKVETLREKIEGKDYDVLRVTWTSFPTNVKQRIARVKVPFDVNALEYNTLSFLYKIEVSGDLPVCDGLKLSRIPQYFYFDQYLDNPGISFASDYDRANWNVWGVTRTHLSQGKRSAEGLPEGWKFFAVDMVNDDPTGNKGFTLDKITSYELTLRNSLIKKDGQKVVFTIARPKVTRGLVYAGGDMRLFGEFKKWKSSYKPMPFRQAVASENRPFSAGRLAKPIPAMKKRFADIEIIRSGRDVRNVIGRKFAAETLKTYLTRALSPLNEIKILLDKPTTNDNVKIFVGLPSATSEYVKGEAEKRRAIIKNSPGYFIINEGKKFYIGGVNFGRVGEDKGIMNGVLDFLEYNVGLFFPRPDGVLRGVSDKWSLPQLLSKKLSEDFAFTWGDHVNLPLLKWWGFSNGTSEYAYRNRASYHGCWYKSDAIEYSSYRSWAANHWFGFGADKDKELWGEKADGTKYRPGCYTGSPCLVKAIEAGKHDFMSSMFTSPIGLSGSYALRLNDDSAPVWIEDTWNSCKCKECSMPFRLPDGSLIDAKDPNFQTEWHIVNAMAYNQMARVYANRDMQLNYLIYFFTLPVPRTPLTAYMRAHFCPYVRADYDLPIYAPVNDKFWRIINEWGQVSRVFGVSDYFLGGNFRPSADIQPLEVYAMRQVGLQWFGQETENDDASFTEMWVAQRMLWEPSWNPDALRAYYCERVFGAGAEDIYNFYAKLRVMRYAENRGVDFEDWAEMGFLALKTAATKKGYANLADELTADIASALKKVEGDETATFFVGKLSDRWARYLQAARAPVK